MTRSPVLSSRLRWSVREATRTAGRRKKAASRRGAQICSGGSASLAPTAAACHCAAESPDAA
eukprot:3769767-Prymnesium_polylepis.1